MRNMSFFLIDRKVVNSDNFGHCLCNRNARAKKSVNAVILGF